MRSLACLLLLAAAPLAQAQMYKCTDGGKTRFSDQPFTDCKTQNQVVKVQPNVALSTPARASIGCRSEAFIGECSVSSGPACFSTRSTSIWPAEFSAPW